MFQRVFVGRMGLSFWLIFRFLSSQALYQYVSVVAEDSGVSGEFPRFCGDFGVSGA